MSEALLTGSRVAAVLAAAHAAVDDVFASDFAVEDSAGLLGSYRELERLRNRLAGLEHAVIAEVERRSLPFELGATSTAALLRDVLRVSKGDASARVRAAQAAGPRTGLTGEPLPAVFAQVAAGQVSGVVSPRQARVVVDTVEKLPDSVQAEHGGQVETDLVAYAQQFDPTQLATLAERISVLLDPDGVLADSEYRNRHRGFAMAVRADGSSRVSGEWTAELTERAQVLFDSLAGP